MFTSLFAPLLSPTTLDHQPFPCAGSGKRTPQTGHVVYGYVGDSCGDPNNWCRDDVNHVDISSGYLASEGLGNNWQNNKIQWSFVAGTPPG